MNQNIILYLYYIELISLDMTTEKPGTTFIAIKAKNNAINISWGYNIFKRPTNEGSVYYIPGFEIYFSVANDDIPDKKASVMVEMFFDHFFDFTESRKVFKAFAIEIHKRGFKAINDNWVMKNFIDGNPINAKFNSPTQGNSSEFTESGIYQESEMEVPC